MKKLDGRIAIITGASAGIGKQIALRYAEEGARLALCARRIEKLNITAKLCEDAGAEVLPFQCDVTQYDQMKAFVEAVVKRFGGVDILYNNAMVMSEMKPFTDHTREDWDVLYESGLLSSFSMMCLCFPYLKESKYGGKVICVGSGAGIQGANGMVAYGAIKEATRAMARHAAVEWGKYNINVNVINPGAITEESFEGVPEEERDPIKMGYDPTLIGRFGDPYQDITPVSVFLASDDSRHITGQTIMVEGGVTLT